MNFAFPVLSHRSVNFHVWVKQKGCGPGFCSTICKIMSGWAVRRKESLIHDVRQKNRGCFLTWFLNSRLPCRHTKCQGRSEKSNGRTHRCSSKWSEEIPRQRWNELGSAWWCDFFVLWKGKWNVSRHKKEFSIPDNCATISWGPFAAAVIAAAYLLMSVRNWPTSAISPRLVRRQSLTVRDRSQALPAI